MKMLARIALLALVLIGVSTANAITLISTATGNINSTGTWSVVDTTGTNAFLNSETANAALTTSPVASSTFTPAAETLTAIGVKLASRAAVPSGTVTIKLANSTVPGTRECTQTVNASDLPTAAAASTGGPEGGWIILTCAASPNGTDAYTITASTSVAAQVNLFSLATTNWSRLLVTTGTQASGPAAGDKFYVLGNLTGAGTGTSFVVTINTTVAVSYGNVANTTVDPSIVVGLRGTLASGTAASTAYVFQHAGPAVCYNGGSFTLGTSGTPIPASGSMTYTQNSTVEGDTGFVGRNGCTVNAFGSANGRTVTKTLLTVTANAAATSLTVADSTGWLNGDSIVIAGTQVTGNSDATSRWDAVSLTANASGTALTVGALTNQHTAVALSYTSSQTGVAYAMNMYAAVINLTRNVIIQGNGSTTNGYLYGAPGTFVAISWTQFNQISGAAAGKRGLELDTGINGTGSITNSAFINAQHTCVLIWPTLANGGGTQAAPFTFTGNVMYNCANTSSSSQTWYGLGIASPPITPYWVIDNFTVIRTAYSTFAAVAISMTGYNGQFTNVTVSGSGAGGTAALILGGVSSSYSQAASTIGGSIGNVWGPINLYANVGYAISMPSPYGVTGTISGLYIWHEQGRFQPSNNLTADPFYLITSGFGIYAVGAGSILTLRNGIIGWDVSQPSGMFPVTLDATNSTMYLDNMELCPIGLTGGVTFLACGSGSGSNQLISINHDQSPVGNNAPANTARVFLRNSSVLNNITTKWPSQGGEEAWYSQKGFVVHDCAACTPVKHGAYVLGGYLSYDTLISHASGYSMRMTPFIPTWSGYISTGAGSTVVGTTMTITSGNPTLNAVPFNLGDTLYSNDGSFLPGTRTLSGSASTYTVSLPQSVGSSGAPVQFQSYSPFFNGVRPRLQSAPFAQGNKVAVASGQAATACVWVRPSINTDPASPWGGSAVTYNADNPRLINRANPYMGVQTDTVLATFAGSAGTWSQLCGTTPTAPADGEFELVVDADQTFTSNVGGSVNIAEWSCTNCGASNGSRFWWNGAVGDAIAPASAPAGVGAFVR